MESEKTCNAYKKKGGGAPPGVLLMPVIPATLEAKIKRFLVQGKSWQKVSKTPQQKNIACACNPSYA
jgi:hypothetical protein